MEEFKTKHLFFFDLINEISNTYKHSFINSECLNHIGIDEPLTFSLSLKYNNLNNVPNFVYPKISDLLDYFDNLLVEIKEILIKLTTPS